MRMVDVAVRSKMVGRNNLITTHGLNLSQEEAEAHTARLGGVSQMVANGVYEIILDMKAQKSLDLFGVSWVKVYESRSDCQASLSAEAR